MFTSFGGGHFDDLAWAPLDHDMTTASTGKDGDGEGISKAIKATRFNALLAQSGALHGISGGCASIGRFESLVVLLVVTHDVSGGKEEENVKSRGCNCSCRPNRLFVRRLHNSVGRLPQSLALPSPSSQIHPESLDSWSDYTTAQAPMFLCAQTSVQMRKKHTSRSVDGNGTACLLGYLPNPYLIYIEFTGIRSMSSWIRCLLHGSILYSPYPCCKAGEVCIGIQVRSV
jgi:hypothetical protein